jgi:hypothetical protein
MRVSAKIRKHKSVTSDLEQYCTFNLTKNILAAQ